MLKVGKPAPDFILPDNNNNNFRLSEYKNKSNIILYFYPRDNTPGCTAQSCSFRDNYAQLSAYDSLIIGVSADSLASHKKFAKEHNLPFRILSDEKNTIQKLYKTRCLFGLLPGRVTYIIDKAGIIRYAFSSHLQIQRHVDDSLKFIKSFAEKKGKASNDK